ncbi:SDR family oxidoreductase [Macrococcoides canis]|uniref:SDR family oxidoreductase n=1 Tax=Macrococcoides canis TaxID=1855823 RepID=UPI00207C2EC0|nr:SDR family oxidoreductase [Macrococcus canis]MCO4096701.1 SDR family oxidoreductase [Macrococcus canis]UTH10025.1 SDR family oxidoreductase [Macrococcus canis]
MNLLITGASGFLGSNLISIIPKNENISVITSSPEKFKNIDFNVNCYSYSDLYEDKIDFDNIDCVIHCGFTRTSEPDKLAESINFTSKLVELSSKSKLKRFINISSQSLYNPKREVPAKETDKVVPTNLYAMAKYSCEVIVSSLLKNSTINHTSIRLASLTGVGFEFRLTDRFVKNVINAKDLSINGNGNQVISYMDGKLAAKVLLELIYKEEKLPELLNVGVENSVRLKEVVSTIVDNARYYNFTPNVEIVDSDDYMNLSLNVNELKKLVDIDLYWDLNKNINEIFERNTFNNKE